MKAKEYLYAMMERDDIAVITSGLYDAMEYECWNLDRMAHELGADRYHSFRRFTFLSIRQQCLRSTRKLSKM